MCAFFRGSSNLLAARLREGEPVRGIDEVGGRFPSVACAADS